MKHLTTNLAALASLLIVGGTPAFAAPSASEAAPIRMLVFLEGGAGNAARAQPHLDTFVARAAKTCGWADAAGKYTTRKKRAMSYIASDAPVFGIISLPAFLALATPHDLEVLGQVTAKSIGGTQYALVSKTAKSFDDCKGKTLTSNHLGHVAFVEQILFDGKTPLSAFELVPQRRAIQPLKAVIRDEAVCALVDDGQLKALETIEGGKAVSTVWRSETLPGVPVVAFGNVVGERSKPFQAALSSLCQGEGESACAAVGIDAIASDDGSVYAALRARFKQP